MNPPAEPIRWSPAFNAVRSMTPPAERKQVVQQCWKALQEAYKEFAFDKICYVACPERKHTGWSKHMALAHRCGNCYAFALYVQHKLQQKYNIVSNIIVGNVPVYYMRPVYDGICHAAVYVPSAEIILDPSIYAPPIPVRFDDTARMEGLPLCAPVPGTVMYEHAKSLTAEAQYKSKAFQVWNRSNPQKQTRVPGNTYEVTVSLYPSLHATPNTTPATQYVYVLRGVDNFDQSITRRVHRLNQSLFRQKTNALGVFTYCVRFQKNLKQIMFSNEQANKQVLLDIDDASWRTKHAWTQDELNFFQNMHYCQLQN